MSGVTGNFSGLDSVIGALAELGSDLAREIPIEASIELEHAIDSEFTLGVDPYGNPWAPLAESTKRRRPWRDDPPLTDTGAMRSGIVVDARAGAIEILVPDPGGYHQDGGPRLPQRKIVPAEGDPMPEMYEAAIRDGGMRAIDRVLDGVPR